MSSASSQAGPTDLPWHVLRELGYRVGAPTSTTAFGALESDADARFCRERFGAEVVDGRRP